ncbi:MAG: alpha/beta fold hydrolase [Chloroflexi bacterium]|nr:MAG: alpha/beta hydrolase [Actinobacteria bacterium 13_1_20CM_2_66_18]TMF69983.1 MAG: alpha/beta fold hydrolase [Chloroflexota bacterium]TMF82358.1 MAG: alpha/beta fold hydrolase [Chloroflexota bacterium]TMG12523.1 MAG: alpha/beta fold hydrolase [Chloroflexota bacterium]
MKAPTSDGIELYYEEEGRGFPLLFIHEFAGDHRSWAPQVRHFSRTYRCITYSARGYPPSDVPADAAAYSQKRAVDDTVAVLDAAGARHAHVVGFSMGGFAALHLVLGHPDRTRSAVIAGVGFGSQPEKREQFRRESHAIADAFQSQGSVRVAETYAVGPGRVQLQNKSPGAWREFADALAQHDATGAALTMRGVQAGRPSLYDLRDELRAITTPVLIIAGDEDEGSLEPSLMLKRTIPTSGLVILPRTGHTANLEDPDAFNDPVGRFLAAVEDDVWRARDPRSVSGSITGVTTP